MKKMINKRLEEAMNSIQGANKITYNHFGDQAIVELNGDTGVYSVNDGIISKVWLSDDLLKELRNAKS